MFYQQLLNKEYRPDHEIPFSRKEIITMLLADNKITGEDVDSFKSFCNILISIYHLEFHNNLEDLKQSYKNFNPDIKDSEDAKESNSKLLVDSLNNINLLMTKANYNEVSADDIEKSLVEASIIPVRLDVDFEELELYKIFYQGQDHGKAIIKGLIPFLKKEIEFEFFNRVLLLFKVKEFSDLNYKKKNNSALKTGKIYLKYFRNIPKLDLEMIFPNPQPKMNLIDKIQIGIPLISGIALLLKEFVYDPYIEKSVASPFEEGISIVALGIFVALFGIAFKVYDQYKYSIMSLLTEIAESLYFKDIGNNEAVLTALIDMAEEAEGKEAILAYYFLFTSPIALSSTQLDENIERWMEETHNIIIDFEVSDGLRKLETLNILTRDNKQRYSVLNLKDTLKNLDHTWDNYFIHK